MEQFGRSRRHHHEPWAILDRKWDHHTLISFTHNCPRSSNGEWPHPHNLCLPRVPWAHTARQAHLRCIHQDRFHTHQEWATRNGRIWVPCLEWAWCHILCTLATQSHNTHTRLILLLWDTPEARQSHEYFHSFLRHIIPPLPRLTFFSHLFESKFPHVAHHIPRQPVSFLIPRGTYTYFLPPIGISSIFTSSSYTVAGLLCSWSSAGARVFGWHFYYDFLSLPFLSWLHPTFSFSIHFLGLFLPGLFLRAFLYLIWWYFTLGCMRYVCFWPVVVWIGVWFHLICWSFSLGHRYRLPFLFVSFGQFMCNLLNTWYPSDLCRFCVIRKMQLLLAGKMSTSSTTNRINGWRVDTILFSLVLW